MSFKPYGRLEDWMPVELFFRAKTHYEEAPTEENHQALLTAAAHASQAPEVASFKPGGIPNQVDDALFFQDDYPLAVVKHPRYSPRDWHAHDFFELIYVCQGNCQNLLRGTTLTMNAGDFCILPPNQPHALSCCCDEGIIVNILIRKSAFQQSFQPLLSDFGLLSSFFSHTLFQKKNSAYLLFQCGDDPILREQVTNMYEEYASFSPFSRSILLGQLIQLLGHLMRAHQLDAVQVHGKANQQPTRITRILQYISDHLQTVTLQDVAQEFSYSSSRCSNIIKEATNKTFTEIVREARSNRAAQLLLDTDKPLMQIAEEVGFCDSSHFHKVFSALYGVTPAQYRKEHHS